MYNDKDYGDESLDDQPITVFDDYEGYDEDISLEVAKELARKSF